MKNSRNRRCLAFLTVIFFLSPPPHLSFVSFPPYLALAVLPSNSSFYSYYRCFVTRPCERAVTKLAQCRSQVKPREDGARTLFFSFTRVRSQPMASDLSCVTLLPRPDRTGKLIAKVKRNKGATPSESLGRLREGGREKEREADRRACRDREKGRKKQAGRGGKRERERQGKKDIRCYRSEPRGLEIGFLAASRDRVEKRKQIRSIRIFSRKTCLKQARNSTTTTTDAPGENQFSRHLI